ncbi:MAG: ATP-binding cassette domain-containing protein [Ignavibacteria bacterium]|jgi:ABC-2 type transport system ATP-binding protein|nr:ATP-binding cassette domain-containing protein [Ignavibacteria bacterium]MCU7504004.1 ATP-binding cassette domain-containing protein [Ignavibacteria bacterium]MCU7515376.1 ATP-binding cassette domain-containing protein [Ignavibacteria bacterium]
MNALEVRNLSKSFGNLRAVDDVSFSVPEGSIFGLIGRNGAGKTTTIRMMMNIYLPDKGEVLLKGEKIGAGFKDKVGYLPEERGLYKKMKVLETILYFAELKGCQGTAVEKKALGYLERFQLMDRKNSKIEDLSKGNQQKVQFITTILHEPDFLILDEPFSGLDPVNINTLKEIILELRKNGKVIILSTHLMDFAEKMCDHLAMIEKGKIILKGSLQEIKNRYQQKNVRIDYEGDISFLKDNPAIEKIDDFGNSAGIRLKDASHCKELLKTIVEHDVTVTKFVLNEITLQEIFIELAGNNARGIETEDAYVK